MVSTYYFVKFLGSSGDVVHDFVIKTPNIVRVLDVCHGWLAGNNYKFNGCIVTSVVCEPLWTGGEENG